MDVWMCGLDCHLSRWSVIHEHPSRKSSHIGVICVHYGMDLRSQILLDADVDRMLRQLGWVSQKPNPAA